MTKKTTEVFVAAKPDYLFESRTTSVRVVTKLYLKPGESPDDFVVRTQRERLIAQYRAEQLTPVPKRVRVYRDTDEYEDRGFVSRQERD